MDPEDVQSFFSWLSNELLLGDLGWLEDVFLYPYSLFIDGEIRVEHSPEETLDYLRSRRLDAQAIGIVSSAGQVREIGETRNQRFPVLVNYFFYNDLNERVATNVSRYLCLQDEQGRLRIESVEIKSSLIPFRDPTIIKT